MSLKNYQRYSEIVNYMNMLKCRFFTKEKTKIVGVSYSKLFGIAQYFYSSLNYYNAQNFEQSKNVLNKLKMNNQIYTICKKQKNI